MRRWEVALDETQRRHAQEARLRSRTMLGAYGLGSTSEPDAPTSRDR